MSKTLTASDRKTLIRLASTMEKGSPERKAILAGLSKASGVVQPKTDKTARLSPKKAWYDVMYPALQKHGVYGPDAYRLAEAAVELAFRDIRGAFGK